MTKYIINIDYLKIYNIGGVFENKKHLSFKREKYSSRHFKLIDQVYLYDQHIGTLESDPFSSVLKANASMLKIENKWLYSKELKYVLGNFYEITGAKINNISRLDIAIDLQSFERGYLPGTLIRHYLQERIVKKGRGKFTVMGNEKNVKEFSYLRFGTRASDVVTYLYNKSEEMEEVKHKSYIFQHWEANGFDKSKNTWRLEFSLSSKANYFIDQESGELSNISLDNILDSTFIKKVAKGLIDRYFRFSIPEDKTRKTRMRDIELIDIGTAKIERINIKEGIDATRSDKILMKNMYRLSKPHSSVNHSANLGAKTVLEWMKQTMYMRDFFERKRRDWDEEFRILDES